MALDSAYDNTRAVADSSQRLASFQERSDRLRAAQPGCLDLRYGPAERNRIDYFFGRPHGPLLVFIHGGYWQARAKETFAFIAEGPLAHGIHVALVGYTLAPEKPLRAIIAEVRAAVLWLSRCSASYGANAGRLYVSGWSAGGHLATAILDESCVRGGLAISGIFDLEPIQLCYLNDKLGLDEAEARRLSPQFNHPEGVTPLYLAYGAEETPELQRQSEAFAMARDSARLPGGIRRLGGHNHFTILEELAKPDGMLTKLVQELTGG